MYIHVKHLNVVSKCWEACWAIEFCNNKYKHDLHTHQHLALRYERINKVACMLTYMNACARTPMCVCKPHADESAAEHQTRTQAMAFPTSQLALDLVTSVREQVQEHAAEVVRVRVRVPRVSCGRCMASF